MLNSTRHQGGGPRLIGPNLVGSLGEGDELGPFCEILGCVTVLKRYPLPPWTGVQQKGGLHTSHDMEGKRRGGSSD